MAARRSGISNVVDTWVYSYKGAEAPEAGDDGEPKGAPVVQERKVKVTLELEKKFGDAETPPFPTEAVKFVAKCRDPEIRIEGTDIEAIRRAVWSALDDSFKIAWSGWYLVRVDPARHYEGTGTGLTFSYNRVEKGVAWDGTELLREYDRFHRAGSSIYKISPWPGVFRDDKGRVTACIPATEANTEALDEFSRRIDAMRQRLADFLRPDNILETLANLSGANPVLPPPRRDGGA